MIPLDFESASAEARQVWKEGIRGKAVEFLLDDGRIIVGRICEQRPADLIAAEHDGGMKVYLQMLLEEYKVFVTRHGEDQYVMWTVKLPRPPCLWYGFSKAGSQDEPVMMDTRGNQCPWHDPDHAVPCPMDYPYSSGCSHWRENVMAHVNLRGITMFPRELPNGISAEDWMMYIMSNNCPRPTPETR